VSQTHSYSRSSPAAALIDDPTKYSTPPSHKFAGLQTPQTGAYSPLGLADIRSLPDSGETPASANPFQDYPPEPTPCNYLAPWAVYAFDWCKWPLQQHSIGDSAGKVAVGSYLEDGHNYVCAYGNWWIAQANKLTRYKYWTPVSPTNRIRNQTREAPKSESALPKLRRRLILTLLLVSYGSPNRPKRPHATYWQPLVTISVYGLCLPRNLQIPAVRSLDHRMRAIILFRS
jgi:hypothetical protein